MAYYVSKGAKLKCSMGSEQSSLEVVHLERPVLLRGEPMANIMDFKPMVNIKPFGRCCSLMNPVVAAATAANYGRLQEMPCIPNPTAPWQGGKMKLDIKGAPALLSTSKCMCMWAGAIEITHPGQDAVYEGGPMTITITDPTIETLQSLESMGGGDGVRGTLGRGLQPLREAIGSGGMGFVPSPPQASGGGSQEADNSTQVPQNTETVAETSAAKETPGLLVKAVKGLAKAYNRQDAEYEVISFGIGNSGINDDLVSEADKKRIRWAIKIDGGIRELVDKKGKKKIILEIPDAWQGKDILVMACIQGFNEKVSCKTSVAPPSSNTLIRVADGATEAYVGEEIWYNVASYNKDNVKDCERKEVKWDIKISGQALEPLVAEDGKRITGEKIFLRVKSELANKEITLMPFRNESTESISQKTKIRSRNHVNVIEQFEGIKTFEELRSKFVPFYNDNKEQIKYLDEDSRNSLIKNLIDEMRANHLNPDWIEKTVTEIRQFEVRYKRAVRIALIAKPQYDNQAQERSPSAGNISGAEEFGSNSELIIFFNVNKLVSTMVSTQRLQSYFVHEFRHLWQTREPSWKDKHRRKHISIEIDAHDIQYEFERGLRLLASGNKLREAFEKIDENYRNYNKNLDWVKKQIENDKVVKLFDPDIGGYNIAHYEI